MCEQIPSVTLWGTTQLPTLISTERVYTTQIVLEPVVTLSAGETVTLTPSSASVVTTQIVTRTVITSLVPQQTLYSPCPDEDAQPTRNAPKHASSADSDTLVGTGEFTGSLPPGRTILPSSSGLVLESYTTSKAGVPETKSSRNPSSAEVLSSGTASGDVASATESSPGSSTTVTAKDQIGPIVGGAVGGVAGLVILIMLIMCIRRSRRRSRSGWEDESYRGSRGSRGGEGEGDDYWERRFRELEAEGGRGRSGSGRGSGEESYTEKGEEGLSESKKLHLTLDLASKTLPSRPASRLSAISSFFTSKFNPTPMVMPSPSHLATGRKSWLDSARLLKRPPHFRSDSDDRRSDRSNPLSHKSGLSGKTQASGASQRLSPFGLPTTQDEKESPVPNTSTPSISVTISTDPAPRPGVERGAFSPTDSEVEERRNMEWIRQSHTTSASRESDRYADLRREQIQRGLLTASALRRISGLNDGLSETPPKLGVLGGGSGGGFPFPVPPTRTASTLTTGSTMTRLPSLPLLANTRDSELTPGDSYSQAGAELQLEHDNENELQSDEDEDEDGNDNEGDDGRSASDRSSVTYSTHPSFGMSRPQSKRDSYKTLSMYKSERGSGRSLYPPRRRPSGGAASTRSRASRSSSKSHHGESGNHSPPPLPIPPPLPLSFSNLSSHHGRVVSGPTTPIMTPRASKSCRSMREHRESRGKHVPEIRLSKRAITPSLWIDEDLLARFADAESDDASHSNSNSRTEVAEVEQAGPEKQMAAVPRSSGPGSSASGGPLRVQSSRSARGRIGIVPQEGKLISRFSANTSEAPSVRSSKARSGAPNKSVHSHGHAQQDAYGGLGTPESPSSEIVEDMPRLDKGKGRAPSSPSPVESTPPEASIPSPKPSPQSFAPALTPQPPVSASAPPARGPIPLLLPANVPERISMPRSPASFTSSSSATSCSTISDEIPLVLARVDRAERSAVTPHLPVKALSANLREWPPRKAVQEGRTGSDEHRAATGGGEGEERLKSVIYDTRRL